MTDDSKNPQQEALRFLRQAGERPDDEVDLTEGALALAVLEHPNVAAESYRSHLAALVTEAQCERPSSRLDDQLRLIRRVLVVHNKYHGDEDFYDDPRAADIMQVIDRRKGSPIMLGIVYLHVAKAVGWSMSGVDFAGHFFLQLKAEDDQVLLDPFRAGQTCSPEYLQNLLVHHEDPADDEADDEAEQDVFGMESAPEAEGRMGPFVYTVAPVPLSSREILLRLQNAVKRRYLAQDKVDPAISTLQRMILLAPRHEEYWRELGYLQAERGSLRAAITALEVVCDLSAEQVKTDQTKDLLKQLRRQLN